MIRLYLLEENSGSGVQYSLNDRVECVLLNEFIPNTPSIGEETVTDQARVQLKGANARAKVQTWNRLFQTARERARSGLGIYLCFAVDQSVAVYQTRLVNGKISIEEGYSKGYKRERLNVTLAFEHLPFWEGPEENIPLSNLNGTNLTTGLRVFGINDLAGTAPNRRCNYADVAAGIIKGDLPAPIKLKVQNSGNTSRMSWVWVGENYTNPATAKWNFEGEAATEASGTVLSDALCSGNSYRRDLLPAGLTPPNTYYVIGNWALSAADLSAAAGQRVRFVLLPHLTFAGAQVLYQLQVGSWTSEWVMANNDWAIAQEELFDFRLPNYLEGVPGLGPTVMQLRVRNATNQSQYWSVDCFMLLPADGWASVSLLLEANQVLMLDGTRNRVYQANADDTNKTGIYYHVGEAMMLKPGKAHRFYFMLAPDGFRMTDMDLKALVSASYRPRRLSI